MAAGTDDHGPEGSGVEPESTGDRGEKVEETLETNKSTGKGFIQPNSDLISMREVAELSTRIKKYRERISRDLPFDSQYIPTCCSNCEQVEKEKKECGKDQNIIGDRDRDSDDDVDDGFACQCEQMYVENSIEGNKDEEGSSGVHCLESSMMNCYGLKSLHDYLQLPFLALKRDHFYQQMRHVEEELNSADKSLRIALMPASKAVYNAFARSYEIRSRYHAVPDQVSSPSSHLSTLSCLSILACLHISTLTPPLTFTLLLSLLIPPIPLLQSSAHLLFCFYC